MKAGKGPLLTLHQEDMECSEMWNSVLLGTDQTDSIFPKEVYTDYENCLSKIRTVKVNNVLPLLQNSEAHITFLDKK